MHQHCCRVQLDADVPGCGRYYCQPCRQGSESSQLKMTTGHSCWPIKLKHCLMLRYQSILTPAPSLESFVTGLQCTKVSACIRLVAMLRQLWKQVQRHGHSLLRLSTHVRRGQSSDSAMSELYACIRRLPIRFDQGACAWASDPFDAACCVHDTFLRLTEFLCVQSLLCLRARSIST